MNIAVKDAANDYISAAQFFEVGLKEYGVADRVEKPPSISIQRRGTSPVPRPSIRTSARSMIIEIHQVTPVVSRSNR